MLEIVGYKVVRKKAQIDINKIRQKKLLIKSLKKIRQNKMLKKTVKKTSLEKTLRKNVTQKFLTNKFMGSLISSFSIFPHMLYCQWQLTSLKKILRDDCGQQCHTSYKYNIRLEKIVAHGIQHFFLLIVNILNSSFIETGAMPIRTKSRNPTVCNWRGPVHSRLTHF